MISWQEITGMRLVCNSCGKPPDTTPGEECAEPLHHEWYERRTKTREKHNVRNYFGKNVFIQTEKQETAGTLLGYSRFSTKTAKILILRKNQEAVEVETREILQLKVV